MLKTTFIIGAGASRYSGAPLVADFLDRADTIRRANPSVAEGALEEVFRAMSEMRPMYAKAYLDLENIEVLFGAIEVAGLIDRFGDRTGEKISQLRESLVRLIVTTLEATIRHTSVDGHVGAPEPYDVFGATLYEAQKRAGIKGDSPYAFISFNYDTALELGLNQSGLNYGYCLGGPQLGAGASPLLKLHGSLNWAGCQECDDITPLGLAPLINQLTSVVGPSPSLSLAPVFANAPKCHGKARKTLPVIVPPTWNKTGYQKQLTHVWRKAAEVLAATEALYIVGYSMPLGDLFFRYLLAMGITSDTRIKKIVLVNPDLDGGVERSLRDFVGRQIEKRIVVWNHKHQSRGTFEEAIRFIRSDLGTA